MLVRSIVAGFCALALSLTASQASAMQFIDLTLASPVNGHSFPALGVPPSPAEGTVLADMGSDDDGCRHSSGQCEYDFYIATDPTTYFTALTVEWDSKSGGFRSPLSNDFKDWVVRHYNAELQNDTNRIYKRISELTRQRGEPVPDRQGFMIRQVDISVERRYRFAVECYEKRNATAATKAKLALNGAWAIRVMLNCQPPSAQYLTDGFAEVNDHISRHIKDGETFQFDKWLRVYKDLFENARLSNEGYLLVGWTYLGLVIRDGDRKVAEDVLTSMSERFKDEEKDQLRGLVRERRRLFYDVRKDPGIAPSPSYIEFLDRTAGYFITAITNEEFSRGSLPVTMLGVAESLRRGGANFRAMDWYIALASLPETQPGLRESIRAQGRFPTADAPLALQLGWRADGYIKRLTDDGVVHPGNKPAGVDKVLLNAIINEGLGTADFVNPAWRPGIGGNQNDLAMVLDQTGKAVLEFSLRRESWPRSLGELWEHGVVRDRNYLNRFHCPVTGKPLQYVVPKLPFTQLQPKTALVVASDPVQCNQGMRYGAILANLTLVWSDKPIQAGTVYDR